MARTVGAYILSRLKEWGVKRIFGYPGDGILGIMSGLARVKGIEFVQARHEEMAAFMACAHAKFTGEVGVCLATSGPGAIHLLNGLYDAKLDHQPVVAIVGQQPRPALGGHYQQEVDLASLFKDVASDFVHVMSSPQQARHLIDRAVRIARAQRTVTCVIIPKDVQEEAVEQPPMEHGTVHSGLDYTTPRVVPKDVDLRRAAEILNSGRRVAMLIGAGCLGVGDEVLEVADVLGAGVAKALLGKAAIPDDAPGCTGSIGLLGTRPSWELMSGCDTLFVVGSSFPYPEFLPGEGQARGVQIDIDPRMVGLRYPMEVNLVGDARETLRALRPLLLKKDDRSWRDRIQRSIGEWWRLLDARAHAKADPVNPQLVFWELSPRLPDRCIITSDSGSAANWFARDLRIRKGMMASLSGNLATMGPAMPYAVAAKFAYPDRPVIVTAGDGAMQMNGLNELITVAKYWREWKNPQLVVLVLNNKDLNQVTWEQRAMAGDPKLPATQEIPDFPYADYAESIGLRGIRVDKPEDVARAWDEALHVDRPCVYEAVVDPNVPPTPPHIQLKFATAYAKTVLRGDPEAMAMIRQTLRDTIGSALREAPGDGRPS